MHSSRKYSDQTIGIDAGRFHGKVNNTTSRSVIVLTTKTLDRTGDPKECDGANRVSHADTPSTLMYLWTTKVAFARDLHRDVTPPKKKNFNTTSTRSVLDDRLLSVMTIQFLSNCNDTLIMQRNASDGIHKLKKSSRWQRD